MRSAVEQLAKSIYAHTNYRIVTHLYGSRVTELAMDDSDVDIFVEIGKLAL